MTQKPADEDLSDSVAMSSNGNATRIRAEKIKTAVPQTNKYGKVFLRELVIYTFSISHHTPKMQIRGL